MCDNKKFDQIVSKPKKYLIFLKYLIVASKWDKIIFNSIYIGS